MNEPKRLREGGGPAAALLSGAELDVPSASRQRALAFTGAAAGVLASGGSAMAASGATLVKSVMLWVAVGTVGGGVMSLTVAETISHFDARSAASATAAAPPLPLPPPRATATSDVTRPIEVSSPVPPAVLPAPATPVVSSAARSATMPKLSAAPPAPVVRAEAPKPPAVSSLFEEQRSIEAARAAVSRGDAGAALATLDEYERTNPRGQFGPEALALRVEALRAQGNLDRARAYAQQFERRYPHHPLLSRVQAAVKR